MNLVEDPAQAQMDAVHDVLDTKAGLLCTEPRPRLAALGFGVWGSLGVRVLCVLGTKKIMRMEEEQRYHGV